MEKRKIYGSVKFSARLIRHAINICRHQTRLINKDSTEKISQLSVSAGDTRWSFDSIDEFLADYGRTDASTISLLIFWNGTDDSLSISVDYATQVCVSSKSRHFIQAAFAVFEEAPPTELQALLPRDPISIFIGHGRDREWERLKAHLQDKHRINVIAYETGARAGHTIRDILTSMANTSSFALLVLTGEDRVENGLRARQNVIHECGLFQGRLGFDRAIMIVEEGIELASNFDGIQQLRFEKGRITEVFGDVIATLKREFGPV